jgi:hypothetical protein
VVGGKRRGPKGPKLAERGSTGDFDILFISRTDLNYLLKNVNGGSLIHSPESPRRIWRLDEEGNKYALGTKPKTVIIKFPQTPH